MADTTHIIRYIPDISAVQKQLGSLQQTQKLLANSLGQEFAKNITVISRSIDQLKVTGKTFIDPNTGKETAEVMGRVKVAFKDAEGNLKTFSTNARVLNNGSLQPLNSTLKDGVKSTGAFGVNILELAKRAAFTIPTWFLLRNAIIGVPRALTQAAKDLVSFDRVLQKAKRNLGGSSEEITRNFKGLREEVTRLSLETGESVETITNAFQKFATVGFNFEEALAGASNSTKLAITLFGDAEETADAFARALRVLVDRSEGAASAQEQIAEAMALTSELWKTNQFDINEVNQGLEKFAAVAKTSNISMRETLVLLSTLGTAATGGARGGTLLRTTLLKLAENADKVASSLGVTIDSTDTTFTVMMKTVDAIAQLGDGFDGMIAKSDALSEVFGGVRGGLPPSTLAAVNELFKENAKVMADVIKFNKDFEEVQESMNRQVQKMGNLIKELTKTFVSSVISTDNATEAITKFNNALEESSFGTRATGRTIGNLLNPVNLLTVAFGVRLLKTLPAVTKAFVGVTSVIGGVTAAIKGLFTVLFLAGGPIALLLKLSVAMAAFQGIQFAKIAEGVQKSEQTFDRVLRGLKKTLDKADLNQLIIDIKDGKLELEDGLAKRLVTQLEKQLTTEFNKEGARIETDVSVSLLPEEQRELSKTIIKDQLDRLKNEGATNSQVIIANKLLNKQFQIKETILEVGNRELELERAKNEEKRLGNRLSSESAKLFEIAQAEGVSVAKTIGDVLAGNTDFSSFVRKGGKELEVFKKEFGDVFKSQQALAFFSGERIPGLDNLRGGQRIDIKERQITGGGVSASVEAALKQNQIESKLLAEKMAQNKAPVDQNTQALLNVSHQLEQFNRNLTINGLTHQSPLNELTPQNMEFLKGALPLLPQGKDVNVAVTVDLNGEQTIAVTTADDFAKAIGNQVGQDIEKAISFKIKNDPHSTIAQAVTERQFKN